MYESLLKLLLPDYIFQASYDERYHIRYQKIKIVSENIIDMFSNIIVVSSYAISYSSVQD